MPNETIFCLSGLVARRLHFVVFDVFSFCSSFRRNESPDDGTTEMFLREQIFAYMKLTPHLLHNEHATQASKHLPVIAANWNWQLE